MSLVLIAVGIVVWGALTFNNILYLKITIKRLKFRGQRTAVWQRILFYFIAIVLAPIYFIIVRV